MAIEAQCAIRAIGTEIEVFTGVTTTGIIAVRTQFHIGAIHKIDRIFAVDRPIGIQNIFRTHRRRRHVAIFIARTMHRVLAILALSTKDTETWNAFLELSNLCKYRSLQINSLAVYTRIEAICPETFMTEDRDSFIRRVDGNDMLLTRATRVLVIVLVITKRQSTSLPTLRTMRRKRYR